MWDKIQDRVREKINKQVTFKEARVIMKQYFENYPVLREIYLKKIMDILTLGKMTLPGVSEENERRAELIMEKIFFEER